MSLSDFFTVTRDGSGDFNVAIGLLIVDVYAGDSSTVQPVTVSGDCRFMVFDGKTDGRFTDPLVTVEKTETSDTGGSGCSDNEQPHDNH